MDYYYDVPLFDMLYIILIDSIRYTTTTNSSNSSSSIESFFYES